MNLYDILSIMIYHIDYMISIRSYMICYAFLSSEWRDEHPNIPISEVISEGTYLESFLEDGLNGLIAQEKIEMKRTNHSQPS